MRHFDAIESTRAASDRGISRGAKADATQRRGSARHGAVKAGAPDRDRAQNKPGRQQPRRRRRPSRATSHRTSPRLHRPALPALPSCAAGGLLPGTPGPALPHDPPSPAAPSASLAATHISHHTSHRNAQQHREGRHYGRDCEGLGKRRHSPDRLNIVVTVTSRLASRSDSEGSRKVAIAHFVVIK